MVALPHFDTLKARVQLLSGNAQIRTAFVKGAIAVVVIYVLIFLTVLIRSDAILKTAQNNLPTKTVMVENSALIKMAHGNRHEVGGAHLEEAILGEKTEHGLLPIIMPDHRNYFTEYSKEFARPAGQKTISILVMGLNVLDKSAKSNIAALPENTAYLVSPYSADTKKTEDYLSSQNREIWLSLPIERATKNSAIIDPGPKALLSRLSFANNQNNLHWTLERAQSYAGVATFSNDAFVKNQPVMRLLLKDIFTRGLGLIDLNPNGLGYFEQNAALHNAPYLRGTINLNNEEWQGRNDKAFAAAKNQADEDGHAFLIVPYYPKLISDLTHWVSTLDADGFVIAPPSSIARTGIADDILFTSHQ